MGLLALTLALLLAQTVYASTVYWIDGLNSKTGWTQSGSGVWNVDNVNFKSGSGCFFLSATNPVAGQYNPTSRIDVSKTIGSFPSLPSYEYYLCFWVNVTTLAVTVDYGNYPYIIVDPNVGGVGIWKSGSGFVFATMYQSTYWRRATTSTTVRDLNTWYKVEAWISPSGMNITVDNVGDIADTVSRPNVAPSSVDLHIWVCSDYSGTDAFKVDTLYLADSIGLSPDEPSEGEVPPEEGVPGQVNLLDLPSKLAYALSIPLFAGQLLASTIVICTFIFPVLLLTRGKSIIALLIVGLATMGFLFALGWLPYWFILILVLIVAGLWSAKVRGWLT
jgi:hypothetical protein